MNGADVKNRSKHFDSIEPFYHATQGSLEALVDELARIVETKDRPVTCGQRDAWRNSLPDLAKLLRDPMGYLRDTVGEQTRLVDELRRFAVPGDLARALKYSSVKQLRQTLEAAAHSLEAQRDSLAEWLAKNGDAPIRFPEELQIELEQPLQVYGSCKRVDALLWRRQEDGKVIYVVMELKQWTEDNIIVDFDRTEVRIKSEENRPLDHPVKQALEYAAMLPGKAVCGHAVEPGSAIHACAYLHNQLYEGSQLYDAGFRKQICEVNGRQDKKRFKLFSRGHCNALIKQLDLWLNAR